MCRSEADLGLMCWREVGLGQVGASEGGRCWGLLEAAAGSRQQPQQTCCLFIPQRPGHPFVRSPFPFFIKSDTGGSLWLDADFGFSQ